MHLKRKCPVCGCEYGREIKKFSFSMAEGIPLPDEYIVVACKDCGFTYADMEASQNQYNQYYANFNMYSEDEDLKDNDIVANRYIVLKEILDNYVDKTDSIIDIGCGGGGALKYLKRCGYKELFGCDPSSKSISRLIDDGISGIVMNIFEDIPRELSDVDGYDIVVSTAVIEHIYDLNGYIDRLLDLLKKGDKSYLILNAPAIEGFDENMKPIANYINHEHINYFSLASLDNLLAMHGMERVNADPYIYEYEEKYIFAVYKRGSVHQIITPDRISYKKMNFLIKENEKNNHKIMHIVESNNSIILWGCGSYSMRLLSDYPQLVEKIEFIVDNNTVKQGTMVQGKEVKNPDSIKSSSCNSVIAIASMRNVDEIKQQILDMKIVNEIVVL